MDITPSPSPSHSRSRRSERQSANPFRAAVRRIWHDWWVEILVGVLVALAIFLLVERMDIRQTLRTSLLVLGQRFGGLGPGLARAVISYVQRITLSDLVAYVLLFGAVSLAMWRTRRRLMTPSRYTALACPRCGGEVHRIHRRWYDRLLDLYVPVRRYQCKDPECCWRGLRVKHSNQG